jgi:hypothetical protein
MVEQPMRHQRVTETSGNTAADAPSSAWSSFHVDRHLVAGPAASDKGAAHSRRSNCRTCTGNFIQDASKLYVDALEHNTTQIAKLVAVCASRRNTPAYVGLGSNASHRHARDVPAMSASHPITTDLVRHNEPALSANRDVTQCSER